MSSLSRVQLRMNNDDTDRLCVHMRRQLRAKDELRQAQNNMGQWNDKTTTRLTHKFELELNAEQERCVIRVKWILNVFVLGPIYTTLLN